MTNHSNDDRATTNIYQANRIAFGLPLLIAAEGLQDALTIATAEWNTPAGGIIVFEVTSQFEALSDTMRTHTDELRFAGLRGVVGYNDDRGWVLVQP